MLLLAASFALGRWVPSIAELPQGSLLLPGAAIRRAGLVLPPSRGSCCPDGFCWSHAYDADCWPFRTAADDANGPERPGGVIDRENGPSPFRFCGKPSMVWETPCDWRIRLSWQDPPTCIRATPGAGGQGARLTATPSPGARDYEGWLYRQGIRWCRLAVSADGPAQALTPSPCCLPEPLARRDQCRHRHRPPVSAFSRGGPCHRHR